MDVLQWPVKRSQTVTNPASSLVITMQSFVCTLRVIIEAGEGNLDSELAATGSVDGIPICQNLIDPSMDDEIRMEENTMEVMLAACPTNVFMRWGYKLVISQI